MRRTTSPTGGEVIYLPSDSLPSVVLAVRKAHYRQLDRHSGQFDKLTANGMNRILTASLRVLCEFYVRFLFLFLTGVPREILVPFYWCSPCARRTFRSLCHGNGGIDPIA